MMQKVCNMHLDGAVVYKPSVMIGMIVAFFAAGFGFMLTYNYPVLRYVLLAVAIAAVIIKRKMIIGFIQTLLKNRQESKNSIA